MKNIKKTIGIIAVLAAIAASFTACASTPNVSGDFTWISDRGSVTIIRYNGPGGDVIIPANIIEGPVVGMGRVLDIGRVVGIGRFAFENREITSIVIPNSVRFIGSNAFANNQLTSVTIPNSVIEIGERAFENNLLENVSITNAQTRFGENVFAGNHPELVIDGGSRVAAAAAPAPAASPAASPAAPASGTYNGFSWTTRAWTGTRLENGLRITRSDQTGDVVIPAEINGIPVRVIQGEIWGSLVLRSQPVFTNLTSVVIPNSVTYIMDNAFENNRLTSVTIPNSVTYIGESAFARNQLSSVTIPNSVISLSGFNNNQLTSVVIPNSVLFIGHYAFENNRLTSVVIPNSVTFIGWQAFQNNQLTSVTISNSVRDIRAEAFALNPITRITIGGNVMIAADAFPAGFVQAYEAAGRTAGTYTRPNITSTNWTWQP